MKYGLVLAVLLCSGCASGVFDSEQPEQQTYLLSAGPPQPASGASLDIDLAVARPIASPGLYTERIAVRHADRRLDYYAGSRWGGTTDVVIQSLLVQSLRDSRRLASVQSDLSAFTAQYLLQTELRDFQADYTDDALAPRVRISFVCTLGRIRAREPLAEYSINAEAQATDNTMRSVITAFEQAYQQAARQVVDETLQALERAEQAQTEPIKDGK